MQGAGGMFADSETLPFNETLYWFNETACAASQTTFLWPRQLCMAHPCLNSTGTDTTVECSESIHWTGTTESLFNGYDKFVCPDICGERECWCRESAARIELQIQAAGNGVHLREDNCTQARSSPPSCHLATFYNNHDCM